MYLSFQDIFPDKTHRLKKKEKNSLQRILQYSKYINNERSFFVIFEQFKYLFENPSIGYLNNTKSIEIIRFFEYLLTTREIEKNLKIAQEREIG